MKSYNQIQEEIEKLEKTIEGLKKEFPIMEGNNNFPEGELDKKELLENDVKTLKWVLDNK